MTFYPTHGSYSREDFSSSSGISFNNEAAQGVVAGYVTLKSTNTGAKNYISNWSNVSNWSLDNPLIDTLNLSEHFEIYSGSISVETNTVTGLVGIDTSTAALAIFSSYPAYITGQGFSGQGAFGIALISDGPVSMLEDSYGAGSTATTFEFDVASLSSYSGLEDLPGYGATGNILTGLPELSGLIGHGFLFCDGDRWDFLEISPYGIRSYNHPELAIPINLLNPSRIRVAFQGNDIAIATQDGRAVYGSNKFDATTTSSIDAFAFWGALSKYSSVCYGNNILTGATASYGRSLFDNIRVLTGQFAISTYSGAVDYATTYVTGYTDTFDPGVFLDGYLYANVGYIPYQGGTTLVTPQYYTGGWVSLSDSTIPLSGNKVSIDLSSIPVSNYPIENASSGYLHNPIRFKIQQKSTNGTSLPPAIDYIEIYGDSTQYEIDLIPDWKISHSNARIKIQTVTGDHRTFKPHEELWSSMLLNTPTNTGVYLNTSLYTGIDSIPIDVVGYGEINRSGPYKSSFKNWTVSTLNAVAGSDAAGYFSTGSVYNVYPNPLFNNGFRPITSGEPNYYSGQVDGLIAQEVRIPSTYTGSHNILFDKQKVYRPKASSREKRIASYNGTAFDPTDNFSQKLKIYPGPTHDGTVGMEAYAPSGIATGYLQVTFDLQIQQGSGISVDLYGDITGTYNLPAEFFSEYRTVSLPSYATNPNEFAVRFYAPSGYDGTEYEFNLDNLTISSYSTSYLSSKNNSAAIHQSGISIDSERYSPAAKRAATVFYTSLYLYSYPTGTNYIVDAKDENGKGFSISLDSSGYLSATLDNLSESWGSAYVNPVVPFLEDLGSTTINSISQVPLSTWVNIGFMHDVHCYSGTAIVSSSGTPPVFNFASTNKAYLTINGKPVASQDLMTGWQNHLSNGTCYPYVSYIPLSGDIDVTLASGVSCMIDGSHLLRPPVGEVEAELTINGARKYVPYFVPDPLYKNGFEDNLLFLASGETYKDAYIGLCYNFSNPVYPNWDRGPTRNHGLINGIHTLEYNSPYSQYNLLSTRLANASFDIPYSSSYHRLLASTGQLGYSTGSSILGTETNNFRMAGWIYPRETGTVFTFYENKNNLTGSRLEVSIAADSGLVIDKYNSTTNAIAFSDTGQTISLSEWNFINLSYLSSGQDQVLYTGVVIPTITNSVEITNSPSTYTGIDYGLIYGVDSMFRVGNIDCNYFNWVFPIGYSGESDYLRDLNISSDKGGSYQHLLVSNLPFTGVVDFNGYQEGYAIFGIADAGEKFVSMAYQNAYNLQPRLNGILAYDNKPFKEVATYKYAYDFSSVEKAFGKTNSPIRLGTNVPESAINIARISSPSFTVPSSVATIDLSDSNVSNLVTYYGGTYDVGGYSSISSTALTGYMGINYALYSGRYDVTFSGQVLSPDIEISTIPIADLESKVFDKAYYYYVIGRGSNCVKTINAYPHFTGQISESYTGQSLDTYTANLQRVINSISLKDSAGKEIPKDTYPYTVVISPYTPSALQSYAASGIDVALDNIGTYHSGQVLPDNIFTAILLTSKNRIPGQSVFVHYDAYNLADQTVYASHKEVVNPQPIFRERTDSEQYSIGLFDTVINTSQFYDLTLYGIATGYSGLI